MKILHIAAHLGGGVGKALSALCRLDGPDIERHFLLLEEPRDTRHVDAIRESGARISIAPAVADMRALVEAADIVQIEWWNHPRLYECLCRSDVPAARTLIWSHISGLFTPLVPPALYAAAHQFLFTSACSLENPAIHALPHDVRARLGVVNSGFGCEGATASDTENPERSNAVSYLGTVDFSKLSPQLFDVIDRAAPDRPVAIWGNVEKEGEVMARAARMAHPDSVHFHGHATDPEAIFRRTGIFLYLLQPQHFGTAENALIEAMSLGCVPITFDNPAERAIVEHGRTGFIEHDVEAAARRLDWLLHNPEAARDIGRNAAQAIVATRSVEQSAAQFTDIYRALLTMDKRRIDYASLLGETPLDWFLSTQEQPYIAPGDAGMARKGSLAHFTTCFPDDTALRRLSAQA